MNNRRMNSRSRRSSPSEGGGSASGPVTPEQGGRERMRGRADGSGAKKNWFSRHKVFSIVALAVIVIGGVLVGVVINAMTDTNTLLNRNPTQEPATSNPVSSGTTALSSSQPGGASAAPTATDELPPGYVFDKDVVNILVLGTDAGMDRVGMGARTDCIILVSINQKTGQVSMISIPRDTYVKIYSEKNKNVVGYNRVNAAFVYGKGLNGNGIAYTVNTVSRYLGGNVAGMIPIDHYVLFDMDLVVAMVNMMGGVTVDVDTALSTSGPSPDPLNLSTGVQKLNGRQALAYARKRHGLANGDIARGLHQQQVMVAMLQELKTQNKIMMLPKLYEALSKYVTTDLNPLMIARLAWIAKDVNISGIKDYTIPGQGLTINGADILVGDQTQKQKVMQEVFGITIKINGDETFNAMLSRIKSQFLSGQATINKAVALLNDNVGFYTASDAQPLKDAINRWKTASSKNNADDMADAQSDVEAEYGALASIIAANKAAAATTPPPSDQPTDTSTDTSAAPTASPTDTTTQAPTDTPATQAPTPSPSQSSDGVQNP